MNDPNTARPSGLLVDYGGVLTSSIHEAFAAFCERESLDFAAFRAALGRAFADEASPAARIEVGAIDAAAFDAELARFLSEGCGATVSAEGLVARLFAGIRRDPLMVEAVRRIRETGVTTVLVSNSWGGAAYEDEVMELLFDHRVISGEVGLRKPNADIYLHALKLASLEADAAVFIDDLPLNCDGAEAVGIRAIHHLDPATTLPVLAALFDVDLADLTARAAARGT